MEGHKEDTGEGSRTSVQCLSPSNRGEFQGFLGRGTHSTLKMDAKPFGQCLAALGLSWKHRCESGKPIDVPILDFRDCRLDASPSGELCRVQLFAQQVRPEAFVLVAGYSECGPGYIPIERAWKEKTTATSRIGVGSTRAARS